MYISPPFLVSQKPCMPDLCETERERQINIAVQLLELAQRILDGVNPTVLTRRRAITQAEGDIDNAITQLRSSFS